MTGERERGRNDRAAADSCFLRRASFISMDLKGAMSNYHSVSHPCYVFPIVFCVNVLSRAQRTRFYRIARATEGITRDARLQRPHENRSLASNRYHLSSWIHLESIWSSFYFDRLTFRMRRSVEHTSISIENQISCALSRESDRVLSISSHFRANQGNADG